MVKDKKLWGKGILIAAVGVFAVTIAIICSDLQKAATSIERFDLKYVPFVLLLIPLNYCIKCIRYHYYLRLAGLYVKVKDEVYSLIAASVMVVTPGKLGEVLLRGYLLKLRKYDISLLTICAMALADRLTEGLAMFVLAAVTVSGLGLSASLQIGALSVSAASFLLIIFLLQNKKLCLKVFRLGEKIPRLKNILTACEDAYRESYIIFTLKPLIISIVLGIAAWAFEAGVVYFSLFALGEELGFSKIVFAVSASGLLGALSMIPGGIGIADGTLLGLLLFCGLDRSTAGIATIISRFSTMWLGVVLGSGLLWQNRKEVAKVINESFLQR